MTVLAKLQDALAMFWQALDDDERRLVAYFALYLAVTTALAWSKQRRDRMIAELREELTRGAAA